MRRSDRCWGRARAERARDVWIADRNVCTLGFVFGLAQRGAYFVIRQHGQMPWEPWPAAPRRSQRDRDGLRAEDSPGERGGPGPARAPGVAEAQDTDRDGDRELSIVTNLSGRRPRQGVADLYRHRWTIETVFRELTQDLASEINTLAIQGGAVRLCGGAGGLQRLAVLKAALRAVHGVERIDGRVGLLPRRRDQRNLPRYGDCHRGEGMGRLSRSDRRQLAPSSRIWRPRSASPLSRSIRAAPSGRSRRAEAIRIRRMSQLRDCSPVVNGASEHLERAGA